MKFAWLCSHESYQPEELLLQAQWAEEAGFDAVFASDHFHPWVDDTSAAGFVWSWFGAVAATTHRVELATSVTCPLFHYHPGLIAQATATLDRISRGRFRLGIGTGEAINEAPLGWTFPSYRERSERIEEAVEIISELLRGTKLDHDGQYYKTNKAKLYSPPNSAVPIWMAAGGPKSARLAGRIADGVIVSVKDPIDALERVIRPFRESSGSQERTVVATRWCVLAEDDEQAWQALSSMRGLRAPGRLEAVDPSELRQRADLMDRSEILAKYAVIPNVQDLVDAYRPLVTEVGADYISIQVASLDPQSTIRAIGSEVLPALRTVRSHESAGIGSVERDA